jgi:Cu/Ag efflux pump CusA
VIGGVITSSILMLVALPGVYGAGGSGGLVARGVPA